MRAIRHRPHPMSFRLAPLVLCCLLGASPARADGLADVVSDLYGGDGISLSQASGFGHDAHFTTLSLEGLDRLSEALSSGIGTYSFSSVTTGFRLDPETGVPERVSQSLGPLLAENPSTLGKGRSNLGLTYIHAEYSCFEGTDLDDLGVVLNHPDANGDGVLAPFQPFPGGPMLDFELDEVHIAIDLEIEQDLWVHFGNFGVTDRLDIGYIIPVISTRVSADALATIVDPTPASNSPHSFDPAKESPESHSGGSACGLGDVLVRTKYDLDGPDAQGMNFALGGQLALPTGDEDDLMGTGEVRAQAIVIGAEEFGRFIFHWNAGYEWVPGNSELDNVRAIVGGEVAFSPRVTGAVDLLGRWEHSGDGIGDALADVAVGAKFGLGRDIVLSANAQLPLVDDDGLRADVIWFVGLEGSF